MAVEHKLSCADIVPYAMENRLNEMQEMWDVFSGNENPTDEITEESFHEYGLSFEYVDDGDDDNNYFCYLISTGGPSEEIRFYCYKSHFGQWVFSEAEFVYLDWFESASEMITGNHLLFVQELFEYFNEIGTLDEEFKKATDYQ
jgi:hypothetical protein